jgi:hypothetical protein
MRGYESHFGQLRYIPRVKKYLSEFIPMGIKAFERSVTQNVHSSFGV